MCAHCVLCLIASLTNYLGSLAYDKSFVVLVLTKIFFLPFTAFAPRSARIVSSSLKMASIFPENPTDLTAGEVSPTGFFDPLK